MGTKITAISKRSSNNQSSPKCHPVFSTARPCTLNPPIIIERVQISIPIRAHFFCLLNIKLNAAKKKEAIITDVSKTFIDSPVYISLNSGVVSHSGYLKQITPSSERQPRKIEK